MTRFLALLFCGSAMFAQQADPRPELLRLADELDTAIRAGDWNKAAALSDTLKGTASDARNQSMAKGGSELGDQILDWLPTDTEVIVVAQQPFKVPAADRSALADTLVMAQGYVLGLLGAAEKESLYKALAGRTIRLAALGAREFANHAPGPQDMLPLGLIAYQGCAIYSFLEPVSESIFQRKPEESVMGHPVWISKGSQNDFKETDTYFVAIPNPNTMLACNNRDFFTQMAARMAVRQTPRALPATLPEWEQVDRSAPLWAVRHIRADRAQQDPSQAGMLGPDGKNLEPIGLTAEFGLVSASAKARMIAKEDPWEAIASSPEFQGAAQSRKLKEGIWELSVANKPQAGAMAVFMLMAFLGFTVYL
jgi:hypothetical protein